jgi:regulatory protein
LNGALRTAIWTTNALSVSLLPAAAARYGPARVRQELKQKGISRETTEAAMRECEIDWARLAKEQAQRKYGEPLPSVFAEKVKIQRFLLYRGYLMEDIQEIWRNFAD